MQHHQLDTLNAQLQAIAQHVRDAISNHNFELAKHILTEQGLKLLPNHPIMLSDLAYVESQLGRHINAYHHLQQALKSYDSTGYQPDEPKSSIYDTLTKVCEKLYRFEEAYFYAKKSMVEKKTNAQRHPPKPLPPRSHTGLHPDKSKNIIAYSLFGANPRYCEVAIINATIAKRIYPEWTCRFYVDDSVPAHVIARLRQHQAQIIMMDKNVRLSGLFWRFLVVADMDVHCFIIRDADSLLSYKERYAVDEWLKSGKFFHIMRDAICHNELILAGMWGGYTGAFPSIEADMQTYFKTLGVLNKAVDQQFLRNYIWTTVNQSVLVHDHHRLESEGLPYPNYPLSDIERIPHFHIGMVDAHSTITASVHDTSATQVEWQLLNANSQAICTYRSHVVVKNGQRVIEVNLPYFYAEQLHQKNWQIQLRTI